MATTWKVKTRKKGEGNWPAWDTQSTHDSEGEAHLTFQGHVSHGGRQVGLFRGSSLVRWVDKDGRNVMPTSRAAPPPATRDDGPDHSRFRFLNPDGIEVAQLVCLDECMARRMLEWAVHGWDHGKLRLLDEGRCEGPTRWITISSAHAPLLPVAAGAAG